MPVSVAGTRIGVRRHYSHSTSFAHDSAFAAALSGSAEELGTVSISGTLLNQTAGDDPEVDPPSETDPPETPTPRYQRDGIHGIDEDEADENEHEKEEEQSTGRTARFAKRGFGLSSVSQEEWEAVLKSKGVSFSGELDLEETTLLNSKYFQICVASMVCLNAIFIGVDTDVNRPDESPEQAASAMLLFWENLFCLAWVVEMIVRLRILGWKYFRDKLNQLDFMLAWLSVFQSWCLPFFEEGPTTTGIKNAMAVLRILKLVRLIKIMYMFKKLWMIARGFMQAVKTLGWVGLLLLFVIYAGGVFMTIMVGYGCTEEYDDWDLCFDHFGTVPRSMFTLFQVMTFESWSTVIARPVLAEKVWLVAFFLFYMLLTSFGLSNVIVGVVVESTLESADVERREEEARQELRLRNELMALRALFEEADDDGSGLVDREEFVGIMGKPLVQKKMKELNLPYEYPAKLFDFIDADESGAITLDEFCDGATRLKQQPSGGEMQHMILQVGVIARKVQDMDRVTRALAKDSGLRQGLGWESSEMGKATPLFDRSRASPSGLASSLNNSTLSDFPEHLTIHEHGALSVCVDAQDPETSECQSPKFAVSQSPSEICSAASPRKIPSKSRSGKLRSATNDRMRDGGTESVGMDFANSSSWAPNASKSTAARLEALEFNVNLILMKLTTIERSVTSGESGSQACREGRIVV